MSFNDLRAVAAQLDKAQHAEDIFGDLKGDKKAQHDALKHTYRSLAGLVHPDKHPLKDDAAFAHQAFSKLNLLHKAAQDKIEAGTYGKRHVAPPAAPAPAPPTIVMVKKRKYVIEQPAFVSGDLADLYRCTYDDGGKDVHAVFKLARAAGDNDLLENESKVLAKLYPAKQKEEKYFRYLPQHLDSFVFRSTGGANRRVNVTPFYEGFYSLAEVLSVYPKGLDYRDVVWMFKRLLVGLGYVHRQGFIHGAIIPPHVIVHPVNHGGRIIDWCYAVESGKDRIKAISKAYRDFYAPEILGKFMPVPATDIYMAVKTAIVMLGGNPAGNIPSNVPKALSGFLSACLAKAPERRPDDAWKLHDELDDLLLRIVGKPKYRPLAMPPTAKA